MLGPLGRGYGSGELADVDGCCMHWCNGCSESGIVNGWDKSGVLEVLHTQYPLIGTR
jgi:hypothetical protein